MKIKLAKSNKAIALIMVMIIILVLGVLAGGFAISMKTEIRLARQASYESEFEWLGRSGVELARCILGKQAENAGEGFDSLKQKWAGGPGNTNDPLADIPMKDFEIFEGRFISLEITDMERKFNVNVADKRILQNAMIQIGVDAGISPMIEDSIIDWIDRDTDEHISGAESEYYLRLEPGYYAKNGWVDDLTELLYVRGVREEPAIYWGGTATNHSSEFSFDRYKREEEPIHYPIGLKDLFSPLGGRVNVNTASAQVLQLIPGIDTNCAAMIVGAFPGRAGPDGQDGTEDDTPFASLQDLNGRNIPCLGTGVGALPVQQFLYVRSRVFEVKVKCKVGDFEKEYYAMLDRANPRDVKVLFAYWR